MLLKPSEPIMFSYFPYCKIKSRMISHFLICPPKVTSFYLYIVKKTLIISVQQSGAVEACWAHNPEVRGSKPRSAKHFFSLFFVFTNAYSKKTSFSKLWPVIVLSISFRKSFWDGYFMTVKVNL